MIFLLSDKNKNMYINPNHIVRVHETNCGILFNMTNGESVELELTLDELNNYLEHINNIK